MLDYTDKIISVLDKDSNCPFKKNPFKVNRSPEINNVNNMCDLQKEVKILEYYDKIM
jgi:hypothetical protein